MLRSSLERLAAIGSDAALCALMNAIQWRRRGEVSRPEEIEVYLEACHSLTREEFHEAPAPEDLRRTAEAHSWKSPCQGGPPENARARAVTLTPLRPGAPTVLILHALMSASDTGYRRMAAWFALRGWNAIFPHLPFHYSRVPRGTLNGELAITSNLVRNAETLRQAVREVRQLMEICRAEGVHKFGILGTSYGGWVGALLTFLEADFEFVALVQPIVDVHAAIWRNPAAASLRRQLLRAGIAEDVSARHAHLSSPLDGLPLCGPEKVILCAGMHDTISPAAALRRLQEKWVGARLLLARQGHFGYRAHKETLEALEASGLLGEVISV